MRNRIGILGGTFDPIHAGHLDLGAAAQTALNIESLLVTPARVPPHRPAPAASTFHRFAMVAIAVAERPGWIASDLELQRDEPSYTSSTLGHFHSIGYSPADLFFVIGADAFSEIGIWKDYPQILDWAHFVVVSRAGRAATSLPSQLPDLADRMTTAPTDSTGTRIPDRPRIFLIDAPTADVSSTTIRRRRADHLPIAGMVSPGVERHIEQHGLYAGKSSDTERGNAGQILGRQVAWPK